MGDIIGTSFVNRKLQDFVSVIYGAVLSYGAYQFAIIFQKIADRIPQAFQPSGFDWVYAKRLILSLGFYFTVSCFVVCDYAGMSKINYFFPYVRPSRFLIDVIIAVLYLMLFIAAATNSILFPVEFAFLLLLCGSWGNNLHVDSRSLQDAHGVKSMGGTDVWDQKVLEKEVASHYGRIIRNSHVMGAFVLFLVAAWLMYENRKPILGGDFGLDFRQGLIVGGVIVIWYFLFVLYAVLFSKDADHLLIPMFPGFIKRAIKKVLDF